MNNNTSQTNITFSMSEVHQRNLCLCLLLFGGGVAGEGSNHGRNRIVVLFISTYNAIDTYHNESCRNL
jgi:hypothetical protein